MHNVLLHTFQSRGESLHQEEDSLEPASRLQSLRDRETLTRFDREVSNKLSLMVVVQYNGAVDF